MTARSPWRQTVLLAVFSACSLGATAQAPADPVLIENSLAKVRRSDYLRELERIPAEIRDGFGNSERRVNDLLRKLLMERTLAAKARAEKLDQVPAVQAKAADQVELVYAEAMIAKIDADAAAEFDANPRVWEARARELYAADRKKYEAPEQVSASHILFSSKTRSPADGERLAREARAKLAAGADFNALAREISEDPTGRATGGQLGWFARAEMDPAFAAAAFALAKPGEVSEPVQSSFGWHLIKLEGRRPPALKPFDEVRPEILAEVKRRFVDQKREAAVLALRNDPATKANAEAIDALVIRVDREAVRRAVEQVAPGAMAPATTAPK